MVAKRFLASLRQVSFRQTKALCVISRSISIIPVTRGENSFPSRFHIVCKRLVVQSFSSNVQPEFYIGQVVRNKKTRVRGLIYNYEIDAMGNKIFTLLNDRNDLTIFKQPEGFNCEEISKFTANELFLVTDPFQSRILHTDIEQYFTGFSYIFNQYLPREDKYKNKHPTDFYRVMDLFERCKLGKFPIPPLAEDLKPGLFTVMGYVDEPRHLREINETVLSILKKMEVILTDKDIDMLVLLRDKQVADAHDGILSDLLQKIREDVQKAEYGLQYPSAMPITTKMTLNELQKLYTLLDHFFLLRHHDKGLAYASGLVLGQSDDGRAVLKYGVEDAQIEKFQRETITPVRFHVGQIVRHTKLGYCATVLAYDFWLGESGTRTPAYWVGALDKDASIGPGGEDTNRFVVESQLEPVTAWRPDMKVTNPQLSRYFSECDAGYCKFRPVHQALYRFPNKFEEALKSDEVPGDTLLKLHELVDVKVFKCKQLLDELYRDSKARYLNCPAAEQVTGDKSRSSRSLNLYFLFYMMQAAGLRQEAAALESLIGQIRFNQEKPEVAVLQRLGMLEATSQNRTKALEIYKLLQSKYDERNHEAFVYFGDALVRQKDPAAAIVNFNKALEYFPRHIGAVAGMVNAWGSQQGEKEKTIQWTHTLLRMSPFLDGYPSRLHELQAGNR